MDMSQLQRHLTPAHLLPKQQQQPKRLVRVNVLMENTIPIQTIAPIIPCVVIITKFRLTAPQDYILTKILEHATGPVRSTAAMDKGRAKIKILFRHQKY